MNPPSAVAQARAFQESAPPTARAVDATAGNGHDTVFLARRVGEAGRVWAVDIQEEALASTRRRLEAEALLSRVTLLQEDHARLPELIPAFAHGRIGAVMFNLGYLPGGDKARITRVDGTRRALDGAWALLAEGGCLSVVAYRGHPGGEEEAEAVHAWIAARAGEGWRIALGEEPNTAARPPLAYAAFKDRGEPG